MKKVYCTLIFAGLMMIMSVNCFAQKSAKTSTTMTVSQEIVKAEIDERHNIGEAQFDSTADFNDFKKYAMMDIKVYQRKIMAMKSKHVGATNHDIAKYQKRIKSLEKRNNSLRMKINGCDHIKTDEWNEFKRSFDYDITQLGHSIRDVTVRHSN